PELGDENRRQDAERDAEGGGEPDHHHRADDGVPEAAARGQRRRRQLAQHREPELLPAAHDEQIEDREQRHEGRNGHRAGEHAHRPAEQRAWSPERALQVGEVLAGRGGIRPTGLVGHRRPFSAASARCTIAVPMTFTRRVIASSTSAAYMRAPTSTAPASGKWFARSAASVLAGENIDQLITFALPASIASAIVSPSARPNPRMTAPRMPVDAVGTMTARIASQRVAPRPKAASRSLGGTSTR